MHLSNSLLIHAISRAQIAPCVVVSGDEVWTAFPAPDESDDEIVLRLSPGAAHDLAERLLRTVPLNGPS